MKINLKKLGMLMLYVLTLALFGNMVVQLLFMTAQMLFGSFMSLQTLTLVLGAIIIITPALLALPFCLEKQDDKKLDDSSPKKD